MKQRIEARACNHCGLEYTPKSANSNKAFCSNKCKLDARARPLSKCLHCAKDYKPKTADRIHYCSRDCSFAAQQVTKKQNAERRQIENPPFSSVWFKLCECCSSTYTAKREKQAYCSDGCRKTLMRDKSLNSYQIKYEQEVNARELVVCKCCKVEFKPIGRSIYCSLKCSRKYAKRIFRAKYGNNHRKRARAFGVHYESINKQKVFDRDGWRCQICGANTPKSRMGTYKLNAPELDHRVPMSKGGDHIWSNVQCACRDCNIA